MRRELVADSLATLPVVVVAAIVVVLTLGLLLIWLLTRDPDVAVTSFGFYVKRDRWGEEPAEPTQQLDRHWPTS
jgi:hypothetical protein